MSGRLLPGSREDFGKVSQFVSDLRDDRQIASGTPGGGIRHVLLRTGIAPPGSRDEFGKTSQFVSDFPGTPADCSRDPGMNSVKRPSLCGKEITVDGSCDCSRDPGTNSVKRPSLCQTSGIQASLTTGHSTTNKAHQSKPVNDSRLALHATTAMLVERKACRRR